MLQGVLIKSSFRTPVLLLTGRRYLVCICFVLGLSDKVGITIQIDLQVKCELHVLPGVYYIILFLVLKALQLHLVVYM